MGNNKLKLNPDEIQNDQIRSCLKSSFAVSFLGNILEPAESVKNLGVILDVENSMQRHVAYLCRICYHHLQELRRVCRYLNPKTAVKVANALVNSRLDYCNALLYNTKRAYTRRLQRVQNAFCRTACKLNKFSHAHRSRTNFSGSPFITQYCSNIISLLIKQYILANIHICPL